MRLNRPPLVTIPFSISVRGVKSVFVIVFGTKGVTNSGVTNSNSIPKLGAVLGVPSSRSVLTVGVAVKLGRLGVAVKLERLGMEICGVCLGKVIKVGTSCS